MTSLPTTTHSQLPAVRGGTALGRPAQAGPSAGGGLTFGQIVSMVQRHMWLVIAVFVAVQIVAGVAYVLCRKYAKEYTAIGVMRVVEPTNLMRSALGDRVDKVAIEMMQREEAARLSNMGTLASLLQQPDKDNWRWVRQHANSDEPLANVLFEHLSAVPNRDAATLVSVRLTDPDPEAAADMVNRLMRFYEAQTRDDVLRSTAANKEALTREREKINYALGRVNASLIDMRQSPDFEGLEKARSDVTDRVQQLGQLLVQSELYLEQAQRLVEAVAQQYQDPNAPPSIEIVNRVDSNQSIVQLRARKQYLLEERAQLERKGFGPNHPSMVEVDVRIAEVISAIDARRAELIALEKEAAVKQAEGRFADAKSQVETIRTNLEEAKKKKLALEQMWAQYRLWQEEKSGYEQQVDKIDDKIREIDVQITRGQPRMQVHLEAAAPSADQISFPKWEMFLAGGLVLGLGLAIGLALLIELIDSSVRTPRDVVDQIRLPLLGFVPMVDNLTDDRDICRVVAADPMSMVAESFRQVRTNLLFAAPVDQLGSIAVTSAARDEGKTTVAVNLAITIALSGRRVLLVDANFRRPTLARLFNLTVPVGLSNLLTNQASFGEVVQSTDVPNLMVIPTGPQPPNPAELLGSATMRSLLDQADAEFDMVIFDSPPALLVTDALVLSTMVDGVIAVVRASETSRGMVGRMRDQLLKVNARIVGAVLNAAKATRGGYFRKSQQQYADYHQVDEAK